MRGYGDRSLVRCADGDDVLHQRLLGLNGGTSVGDLDHSWAGTHSAWANGQYSKWIPAKTWTTMGYCTRQDILFQYAPGRPRPPGRRTSS